MILDALLCGKTTKFNFWDSASNCFSCPNFSDFFFFKFLFAFYGLSGLFYF